MEVGNTVEYITDKGPTGVVGVITGFWEERARVLCPSGHEWLLRKTSLRLLETIPTRPISPETIEQ